MFGTGHLIDVLRGTTTEKVEKFRHDQIKTFGVGADMSKQEWGSDLPPARRRRLPDRRS